MTSSNVEYDSNDMDSLDGLCHRCAPGSCRLHHLPQDLLVGGHVIYASLDALAIVQLRKANNSVAHGIEVAELEWRAALVVSAALWDFVCIVRSNTLHRRC